MKNLSLNIAALCCLCIVLFGSCKNTPSSEMSSINTDSTVIDSSSINMDSKVSESIIDSAKIKPETGVCFIPPVIIECEDISDIVVGGCTGYPEIINDTLEVKNKNKEPFHNVEQMPDFPGGTEALMQFLKDNLEYPESAEHDGVQGRVVIRFVVNKEGVLRDWQVLRSPHPDMEKEAVRLILTMPRWIPGKQNGIPVDVYYTIPITFKLDS